MEDDIESLLLWPSDGGASVLISFVVPEAQKAATEAFMGSAAMEVGESNGPGSG